MGIKMGFSIEAFDDFIIKSQNLLEERLKEAMATLVDECVEMIRTKPQEESWFNRTGNLRSSIGGAVYDRGEIYMNTAFDTVLTGYEGSALGMRMIEDLASQYSTAIGMVVIAAMPYAEDVEALESKDVLESTRLWAASVVEGRLNEAKEKAIEEINKWKI